MGCSNYANFNFNSCCSETHFSMPFDQQPFIDALTNSVVKESIEKQKRFIRIFDVQDAEIIENEPNKFK